MCSSDLVEQSAPVDDNKEQNDSKDFSEEDNILPNFFANINSNTVSSDDTSSNDSNNSQEKDEEQNGNCSDGNISEVEENNNTEGDNNGNI